VGLHWSTRGRGIRWGELIRAGFCWLQLEARPDGVRGPFPRAACLAHSALGGVPHAHLARVEPGHNEARRRWSGADDPGGWERPQRLDQQHWLCPGRLAAPDAPPDQLGFWRQHHPAAFDQRRGSVSSVGAAWRGGNSKHPNAPLAFGDAGSDGRRCHAAAGAGCAQHCDDCPDPGDALAVQLCDLALACRGGRGAPAPAPAAAPDARTQRPLVQGIEPDVLTGRQPAGTAHPCIRGHTGDSDLRRGGAQPTASTPRGVCAGRERCGQRLPGTHHAGHSGARPATLSS
jgi:hypothetical protein